MGTDEFAFSWDGAGAVSAYEQLHVISFEGHEEISGLYHYEITLLAEIAALEVDPADLIHRRATLRIRTVSAPGFRVVHGVIAEARELTPTPQGQPYRIVLRPPLLRALYRKRSRIFLGKTTRQIINAVLEGDPMLRRADGAEVEEDDGSKAYVPATEQFTWRVRDPSRLDDARPRGYCVQYEESDLAFVSRLLEAEGIGYHFENGRGACLLVLSDHDGGAAHLDGPVGPTVTGREVYEIGPGSALRTEGVTLDDFNWKKPALDMTVKAGPSAGLHLADYPGGYPDTPAQGKLLAVAIEERYRTEASFAAGHGPLRVLSAGALLTLLHPSHEGDYLVTKLRVRGEAQGFKAIPGQPLGVFYSWFDCVPAGGSSARFRPARRTPWPRIVGAQTAVVTAEPSSSAEVDVGGPDGLSIGCVRLKFHWDDDAERQAKEPTSCWVRVSQSFAGRSQGAVWHPRVGVEVIVEHEEGNPDRPVVTGRVYNGQNLPPYGGSPVHSTLKSFSTPGGGAWNEVTFNDTAGSELVFVNAGKDETINVNNHRLENIGNNATMTVGANNTESIGANCTVDIGANDTLTVGANQTITIGANSTVTVGGNSDKTVGGNETITISGNQSIEVASSLTETVLGAVTEDYGASRTTEVTGNETVTHSATKTVTVAGKVGQTFGSHELTVNGFRLIAVGGEQTTEVTGPVEQQIGGALIHLVGGNHKTQSAASITRNTPVYLVLTGYEIKAKGTSNKAKGIAIGIAGVKLSAKAVSLEACGAKIEFMGFKATPTHCKIEVTGLRLELIAATVSMTTVHLVMSTLVLMV